MTGAFDAGSVKAKLVLAIDEWSKNVDQAKKDVGELGQVVATNREKIKELGIRNRNFINVQCTLCHREFHIRVNDKSIYTQKYFDTYVCPLCK